MWLPAMVDDLVDIVVSNEYYIKKLVKEVTNSSTNDVYKQVQEEFRARCAVEMSIEQIRSRFKNCVKAVNKVSSCYSYGDLILIIGKH